MKLIIIDLFCGGGGFSHGFAQVFPNAIFIGIDKEPLALETYRNNITNSMTVQVDVRWINIPVLVDSLKRKFGPSAHFILIGSPPCQPFSGMNIRGKRDMDPTLIKVFLKVVELLEPEYWVMEESPFAAKFVPVKYRKFQCANWHRLYHRRRRLFAGKYPTVNPTARKATKHPTITAQEVKAFKRTAKHDWKRAKNCMTWFGRKMDSRELQVLMGFPWGYEFSGNYKERIIQIGNAVCPPVARAIAIAIKKKLPNSNTLTIEAPFTPLETFL